MTDKEILAAMKEMLIEEREYTGAKFEAAQKTTNTKIAAAQKESNAKFAAMDTKIEAAQKENNAKFAAMDTKIETTTKEIVQQIKVLLENGVEKQIKILAECHAQLLARLPDAEEQGEIESRVTTLEHIATEHTKEIKQLQQVR